MASFEQLKTADPKDIPPAEMAKAFYQGTVALGKYVHEKIRPILDATLKLSDREVAMVGTFRRMAVWVDSLVRLGHDAIQFQATAAACRGLFELLMDLKFLDADTTSKSTERFHAYTDVDRYWVADKFVEYKTAHPKANLFSIRAYKERVDKVGEKARVEALIVANWGKTAKGKIEFPDHWTNMNARERADSLGEEFGETYRFLYPMTSWNIHAGFSGQEGLGVGTYSLYVAQFNAFSQDFFMEGLKVTARVLKLDAAISELGKQLNELGQVRGLALLKALGDRIDASVAKTCNPTTAPSSPASAPTKASGT